MSKLVFLHAQDVPLTTFRTGKLREPLSSLERADVLMLTRSNLVESDDLRKIKDLLRNHSAETEMILSENRTATVTRIEEFTGGSGNRTELGELKTQRGFLFCALGNPHSFLTQMKGDGLDLVGHRFLRDHSSYDKTTVSSIEHEAMGLGADYLITTPKDAVKLKYSQPKLPCFVVETIPVLTDENRFAEMLRSAVAKQ